MGVYSYPVKGVLDPPLLLFNSASNFYPGSPPLRSGFSTGPMSHRCVEKTRSFMSVLD